ncbi:MAG: M20/M25/M40 family metallo-hydrolase [Pseudomonadota bacterium]|nr:M20/M25/M40 family metallo-hydrolase [Pseudomonadota bacterium]
MSKVTMGVAPGKLCLGLVLLITAAPAMADLLSNVRQLTFEGRRAGEGYFSADGSLMVFQSERDTSNPFYQIYLMDLETGDTERVSPGTGKTTCAWIHPSNRQVLYASTHEDPDAGKKMREELDFREAGKERRYAWDYDEHFDVYVQDLESGDLRNVTRTPGYDAEAAFSPDGRQIVFASNRRAYSGEMTPGEAAVFEHDKSSMMDLYLMDADGTNVRRLTTAPGYDGGPFFSADGKRITWRRFSGDGATAEIYIMDLAGGEEKQVTRMGVMSWAPFFHPSGEYLIFTSNREGFANFELFMVDAEGRGEPVRVTQRDGFDGLPVFSPDGKRLSWTSSLTDGKRSQIFTADWDHAEARRLLGLDTGVDTVRKGATLASIPTTVTDISENDVRLHVGRLAAAEMAGRMTGSEGERKASEYIAHAFEKLGLEPGGDGDVWFQSFPFTAGVNPGDGNRLELTGVANIPELELDRDWRPLGLSRVGDIPAGDIAFAGYGIVAPGMNGVPDYNSYGDLDVEGKWVMVFRFQPESVPSDWRRHLVHYSDLAYKASVAKRRGALGLIVVTGPNAAARDRLVELKQEAGGSGTSLGAVSVSDDLAARILAAAGKDLKALQDALDSGQENTGFAIPGVRLAASIDFVREQRHGRNVIGILKTDPPGKLPPVILGAHLDHLGRGQVSGSLATDDERGEIHFGADDNASGVAALLEAAQYLAERKRQGKLRAVRDIWFVAWSGEELGTLGSTYFVDQAADGEAGLRGRVSAYLNMDMVGHLREKAWLQGTGSSPVWSREIERRNVPVGLPVATQEDPYLPTDSTPFYMRGVPVLNAFTGAHEDYSTPRDTADKLNYEGIRDIARLVAGITASLARSGEEPEYREMERRGTGLSRKHLRAYLGTIPAYGQEDGLKGVKLQGAVKGSPAEKAGVRGGDVLVGLAGVEIETIHDFMSGLAGLKVGETVEMTVLRDGAALRLEVVPASRE